MNMTSKGIGWEATQIITGYTGSTISVPVGCVVAVTSTSKDLLTAKFSGTFVSMELPMAVDGEVSTLTGSSFGLTLIEKEGFIPKKWGGYSSGSPRRKGGSINGYSFIDKCRALGRRDNRILKNNSDPKDRDLVKDNQQFIKQFNDRIYRECVPQWWLHVREYILEYKFRQKCTCVESVIVSLKEVA